MNFLSMEYFMTIAELGSFRQAASKLFVSQQSLSEHVKKLEQELGVPLFNRGRTLSLTVEGECFERGVKEILSVRNRMFEDIANVTDKRHRKITVAVATYDTPPFLPELLQRYSQLYPHYEVSIVKRLTSDISHNMSGVDLYFSFLPLDEDLEHIFLLDDDPFVVCINQTLLDNTYGFRWSGIEERLLATRDLSLLRELPFVLLYDRNKLLSRDLNHMFRQYAFTPQVGFQSENGDLNVTMCIRGVGALLAPRDFFLRKLDQYFAAATTTMKLYQINPMGLKSTLAISYKKREQLNPAELHFIELARSFVQNNPPGHSL